MCLQNNSKREVRILINFSGNVNNGRQNRLLRFGDDPGYCLDPGIFKGFFLSLHSQSIVQELFLGGGVLVDA